VASRLHVLGCMLVRRCVAAPDVSALRTSSEMKPPLSMLETLNAASSARRYSLVDLVFSHVHRLRRSSARGYRALQPRSPLGSRVSRVERRQVVACTRAGHRRPRVENASQVRSVGRPRRCPQASSRLSRGEDQSSRQKPKRLRTPRRAVTRRIAGSAAHETPRSEGPGNQGSPRDGA
jgi:hypothetical protein